MKHFILAFALLVSVIACKDDDDANCDTLSSAIVGKWTVTVLGVNTGTVQFFTNGTLEDNTGALIGGNIGGVELDQKSYVVNSNSSITLKAQHGSDSVQNDFDVTSFDCDQIVINVSGVTVLLDDAD